MLCHLFLVVHLFGQQSPRVLDRSLSDDLWRSININPSDSRLASRVLQRGELRLEHPRAHKVAFSVGNSFREEFGRSVAVKEEGDEVVRGRLVDVFLGFSLGVVWWLGSVVVFRYALVQTQGYTREGDNGRVTYQIVGCWWDCLDVTSEDISVPLFQCRTSNNDSSTSNSPVGFRRNVAVVPLLLTVSLGWMSATAL